MYCNFCGNEMQPEDKRCPACGKKMSALSTGVKVTISILCAAVLIAVVAVAVLLGRDAGGSKDATATPTVTESTENTEATAGAPAGSVSYTVTDEEAAAKAEEVVATVGTTQLTNAQLQVLYRSQVYGFLNNYAYYLSSFGLDVTMDLDQQTCYIDSSKSWQEYFLESAVESWKSYAVLCEMAKAENYQLSADAQESIANIDADMQESATAGGYESVAAMVLAEGGPGATELGFTQYQEMLYTSMDYFNTKYNAMTPTAEEIEEYFNENAEAYEQAGQGKDAGKTVDVRHILIKVTGGTTDADNNTTYSDQEWADCQAKAQQIYQQWLDGEATEDSFAQLANEVSEDGGSNTNGGLYTGVAAGQMVTEFNDWIMDESRKEGDSGLVKTEFGYHIMYYCAGEDVWYTTAKADLLSERFSEFYSSGEALYPMEADYSKIVLGELKLVSED